MGKKNIFIIAGIVLIALIVLVMAADFTPQGNINLRDTYNITGAPYVNATTYYGNGSQLTGILTSGGEGDFNVNSSDYWDGMDSINATQMENSGGYLNILVSWLTGLFYEKSEVYNKTEVYNKSDVDNNLSNYILSSEEGNLNVNGSNYWDNYNTTNATQIENSGGVLNILVSWLTGLFYTKAEVDSNFSLYIPDSDLPLANKTLPYCGNITGPDADFCVDADTTYTGGDALTLDGTEFDFDGGSSPGGELGNTWASPTVDSGIHDDEYEPISAHFDADTTTNITCLDNACSWYNNATDFCTYWPSGGKDCGAA